MREGISVLTLTTTAAAAVLTNRFVLGGAPALAAGHAAGVAQSDAPAGGVFACMAMGLAVVEAGAAIPADGLIEVGAAGVAMPLTAGVAVARLAPGEVAATVGRRVAVVLIPN